MFGFSVWHITVVVLAALVFIGPKEIPRVMHVLGRAVGGARRLSGEFHAQFNELMREVELAERHDGTQEKDVTRTQEAPGPISHDTNSHLAPEDISSDSRPPHRRPDPADV